MAKDNPKYISSEQRIWNKAKNKTKGTREFFGEAIKGVYGATVGILLRTPTSIRKIANGQTFMQRYLLDDFGPKEYHKIIGAMMGGLAGLMADYKIMNDVVTSAYNNNYLPLAVLAASNLFFLGCELGYASGKKEVREEQVSLEEEQLERETAALEGYGKHAFLLDKKSATPEEGDGEYRKLCLKVNGKKSAEFKQLVEEYRKVNLKEEQLSEGGGGGLARFEEEQIETESIKGQNFIQRYFTRCFKPKEHRKLAGKLEILTEEQIKGESATFEEKTGKYQEFSLENLTNEEIEPLRTWQ